AVGRASDGADRAGGGLQPAHRGRYPGPRPAICGQGRGLEVGRAEPRASADGARQDERGQARQEADASEVRAVIAHAASASAACERDRVDLATAWFRRMPGGPTNGGNM